MKEKCRLVIEELVSTDSGPIVNFRNEYIYKCGADKGLCRDPRSLDGCSLEYSKLCPYLSDGK